MKLVVTDWQTVSDGDLSPEPLRSFGEVTLYSLTPPSLTAERIADADMVLCNKTPMTAQVLKGAAHLRYIGLFATGFNNIDLGYTQSHGITVCNAGGYSTEAVAQHVFALLLHEMSRVSEYDRFVKDGKWIDSDVFSPFCYEQTELDGLTMGVVGYGKIGRAVARIARAFGMRVLVYTRTCPEEEGDAECVGFFELLRESDVISVHCPLTPQTENLFDASAFAQCKNGAFFINTSRGGVVDETALRRALEDGTLRGTALDVLRQEPMRPDCPLIGAPHCLITPHIAWAPLRTRERLLSLVCDNLRAYLSGAPQNVL